MLLIFLFILLCFSETFHLLVMHLFSWLLVALFSFGGALLIAYILLVKL